MDVILVEGVNLYQNLFETDQLSVIRGTSFLYKDAVTHIATTFESKLEPIRTGASNGLFIAKQGTICSELCDNINEELREQSDFSLLPFIVVSTSASSLHEAIVQLLTKLRFEQLRTPTVIPDHTIPGYSAGACELSGTRIQARDCVRKIQSGVNATTRKLSRSIDSRYRIGRDRKQEFYRHLVSANACTALQSYEFAQSFEDISIDPSTELNLEAPVFPKLSGKLAVFYADGNKISTVQQEYLERFASQEDGGDIKAQQNFDREIQQCRNNFLNDTVEWLLKEERLTGYAPLSSGKDKQKKILRLETLLWGGDEMIFVLPAWQGFDFLQRFFAWQWEFEGLDKPLTHAAGLVFCHDKSPIRIIQHLAQQLAENIKISENGREKDGWDYLVLESIDYPTNPDLNHFNRQRYGKNASKVRTAALPPISDWSTENKVLHDFINSCPISSKQLYGIAHSIQYQENFDELSPWSHYFKDSQQPNKPSHPVAAAELRLWQVSDHKPWLEHQLPILAKSWFNLDFEKPSERIWVWLHFSELWDYLAPENNVPTVSSVGMPPIEEVVR